ncbi:hypothetical protein C8E97_3356 [Saccharothrix australiensis]|uniref:LmbU and cloE-like protein n=1 Tax=Saccharothrix australiensis TaxID=2072 RepID=A0A495W4H4_9PSEU|nr:hypothetical protein C8E97_3356 [Saccharothrix australiensis]
MQRSPAVNSGPTSTARPVLTKRTSLALPARIPLEDWRGIGQHISAIAESSAWWLGDWLIYGQEEYPDRYRRAIEETGLDYQTLRNYAWVARRFPPARRRAALSFQHHAELASLTAGEQDEWLDRAEEFRWSRNELRNRVRVGRRAVKPAEDARLRVDIIPDQRQRWQDAAATAEQDLLTWIVSVLDEAAADPPVD